MFAFCDNWGTDTVEQLAGGTVTLWFASESGTGVWDETTLTYTLSDAGAFKEFPSQKIFEESRDLLA